MSAAALTWWAQAAEAALDLVVPQQCAGCGAPGLVWCPRCARACGAGSVRVPGPVPVRAACEHAGPAGRAVVAFKDDQVRRLGRPLGDAAGARAVSDALADAGAPRGVPVWVVPVPSRRSAVRSRGADHTAVLAGRAARVLRGSGIPAHRCPALEHVRASRDQVGLTREQRTAERRGLAARARPAAGGDRDRRRRDHDRGHPGRGGAGTGRGRSRCRVRRDRHVVAGTPHRASGTRAD